MLILQKWICMDTGEASEAACNTVVYVEGEYQLNPNCPECGSEKAMVCKGLHKFVDHKIFIQ